MSIRRKEEPHIPAIAATKPHSTEPKASEWVPLVVVMIGAVRLDPTPSSVPGCEPCEMKVEAVGARTGNYMFTK
jgi:hypothetical protein